MGRSRIAILLLMSLCRLWYSAPLAAADGPVLISDDFSTLNPAWGKADDHVRVSEGKLIVRPDLDSIHHRLYHVNPPLGDIDVRVKAALIEGGVDNVGGIVFWGSDEGYYMARFFADGYFGIGRNIRGRWLHPVRNQVQKELKQGLGAVNELRIVTSGDQATAYINGQEVATFKGFPPEGGGAVGLFGGAAGIPYEWAFSEFSIRQGPTLKATAPRDAESLFADDFATLDPAWHEPDNLQKVEDHKLIMSLGPKDSATSLYGGNLFGDADIRVKLALKQGGVDTPAGLVFWASNPENYYFARLYSDGLCGITRISQNKSEKVAIDRPFDAVKKGIGEVNELRVVTKGNVATFYVNDQPIATCQGKPPELGSQIGLRAVSAAELYTWAFADLKVRKLPEKQGELALLVDDFSTLAPGWGAADNVQSVQDHKLIITPAPKSTHMSFYSGKNFGDVDIHAQLVAVAGENRSAGGIVFWGADSKNYYKVLLSPIGNYAVIRYVNGKQLVLVPGAAHSAVKKGIGEVNELRVVTCGRSATIFVNGQQVTAFKGFPPNAATQIGFTATSGDQAVVWAFSDLVVVKGPVPPPTKEDDELLFIDDFSVLDPGWGMARDEVKVASNKLIVTPDVMFTNIYSGTLFESADIRVNATLTRGGGAKTANAGIVFWAEDSENYHVALLTSDGYCHVLRYSQGLMKIVGRNVKSPAIKQGAGETNELRVVTKGNKAEIYANGQRVNSAVSTAVPAGGSQIGLQAWGKDKDTWAFSHFTIRKVPDP